MKQYETPDFDVTAYEVEDIITLSVSSDADTSFEQNGWVVIQ